MAALVLFQKDYLDILDKVNKSPGVIDAHYASRLKTAAVKQREFNATLQNSNDALGKTMLPTYTSALEKLTKAMQSITEFANKNPEIVKWAVIVATAFIGIGIAFTALRYGYLLVIKTLLDGIMWISKMTGLTKTLASGLKALSVVARGSVVTGIAAMSEAFATFMAATWIARFEMFTAMCGTLATRLTAIAGAVYAIKGINFIAETAGKIGEAQQRHGLYSKPQSQGEGAAKMEDYKQELDEINAKLEKLKANSRDPETFAISNQAILARKQELETAIQLLAQDMQKAGLDAAQSFADGLKAGAPNIEAEAAAINGRMKAILGNGIGGAAPAIPAPQSRPLPQSAVPKRTSGANTPAPQQQANVSPTFNFTISGNADAGDIEQRVRRALREETQSLVRSTYSDLGFA
jgi:hypothetical protein